MLAPYACQPDASRGRLHHERMSSFRSQFQRDRDRIIHSSAFRRLKHKTQVFVEHEGDYYRTRLTHTIEVAQVARTIAGVLGLNTDLAEAVALAHDLGHTPFGHTGEDALGALMAPYGGFDHNAQAIRIVTRLERHYADFDGLNLTWESLEGIAKHNGPLIGPFAREAGPLPYALVEANAEWDLELHTFASAEAQVAAISDDVAYSHHDLHDGLRSGLFTESDLMELPVTGPAFAEVDALYPGLDKMRRRHEALRRVFGRMVEDVIAVAKNRLDAAQPKSVEDIRAMEGNRKMGVLGRRDDDRLNRWIGNKQPPIARRPGKAIHVTIAGSAAFGCRRDHFQPGPQRCVEHRSHGLHRHGMRLAHIAAPDDSDADWSHLPPLKIVIETGCKSGILKSNRGSIGKNGLGKDHAARPFCGGRPGRDGPVRGPTRHVHRRSHALQCGLGRIVGQYCRGIGTTRLAIVLGDCGLG